MHMPGGTVLGLYVCVCVNDYFCATDHEMACEQYEQFQYDKHTKINW